MDFADLAVGPAPQLPRSVHEARRRALAAKLGDGNALVVATHAPHQYSNDVEYLFRPHSDFWYLTGFDEPRALLVLHGGSGGTDLFVQPRKKDAEIWTGRRLGCDRAPRALGIDRAHSWDEVASTLPGILGKAKVHALADHDPAVKRRIQRAAGKRMVADPLDGRPGGPARKAGKRKGPPHGSTLLHEMRLVKSPEEMRMLRKACDLGVAGHLEAATRIRAGVPEYQVEAAFAHHARHNGSNGVGYPSICGCGPNAAILHYVTNRGTLRKGQLFLADMGCEWGWYTSDITRTLPVGGEFSTRQAEVYDLVHAAQKAAMRKVKPGALFSDVHDKAALVINDGLVDLGLIAMDKERSMKEKAFRAFFMHGTSHWLGLDVHDAGARTEPDGKPRRLREGMVLTVEPGLYFNPDFAECPPGTAGIGIRIEDDVAVTADGFSNLTRALPAEMDAVAGLVSRA
ncbi:MAG TPA: aminopeptidase P N-terminal domain-containing protein [Candidatus Thermoplasmatota archaeon]|nr:aminopeptidase P N-terminal domain-containing protein [Candidatus Thermoplasmatota archaeon]